MVTNDELIEQLMIADFAEADEILKGLRSGEYQLIDHSSDSIKCRSLLLPIRSKIPVLENQFLQTDVVLRRIEQSKKLVKAWENQDELNCNICRINLNDEQFYLVFYNSETNDIFGALIDVNKEFANKYFKRKSMDL